MNLRPLLYFVVLFHCFALCAQERYRTSEGTIQFDASTPLEDIHAVNDKVNAILDTNSGELAVLLLNREFVFKKRLMQEHFNENYMESHRFPKSVFKGRIANFSTDSLRGKAGATTFPLNGELTVHGVTNPLSTEISLSMEGNAVIIDLGFTVQTEAHKIKVPRLLFKKVAREIEVSGKLRLTPQTE